MEYPLISVVMCTYNGAAFLEEQIESILQQTYPNLQLVIRDDASTDNTQALLAKYENYPNVRIDYNEVNLGFAKNFEKALPSASGEYIALSDQDDVWLPEKVMLLYEAIEDYSIVYSDSWFTNSEKQPTGEKLSTFYRLQDINDSRPFWFINPVAGHTLLMKADLIETCLPIPNGWFHDWWIAIQAANKNGIRYLDKPLTYYRRHETTATKKLPKDKGSRKSEVRYRDFERDLAIIATLKNNVYEKNQWFYIQLYRLYAEKANGKYVWALFFFLLKYRSEIFAFSKKSRLSQLLEIRKRARGERKVLYR